jgi:hypothetical protein
MAAQKLIEHGNPLIVRTGGQTIGPLLQFRHRVSSP